MHVFIFYLKILKIHLINIGTGKDYSILDYANRIMKILNINLKIKYINKQLSGTPRKLLDCTLAKKLGWKSKISLDKGLTETIYVCVKITKNMLNYSKEFF